MTKKTMQERPLTQHQERVLRLINSSNGLSTRNVADRIGLSTGTVLKAVNALHRRELIVIKPLADSLKQGVTRLYYPAEAAHQPKQKPPLCALSGEVNQATEASQIALPRRFEFKPYTPPKNDTPARPGALDHTLVPSLRHSGERVPYAPPSVHCTGRHINHLGAIPNNPRHAL